MKHAIPFGALAALALLPAPAAAEFKPKLDLSADLRLRLEQDWDSQTAAGVKRLERTRARIRFRGNARLDLGDGFSLNGRLRTGGNGSQQNANITVADFDHNPVNTLDFVADRYSLAWKKDAGGIEVGRMAFPFFTPNEYFWDADISPPGAAANYAIPISGKTRLKLNGGAFLLPVGLSHFSGRLVAGQFVVDGGPATIAAGLFRFNADRTDPDRLKLLDGNGSRDYSVAALNAQYKLPAGGSALVLGADLYRNFKSYADSAGPISRANTSQRTGYVLSATWGDNSAAHHVQLGYRYFHIEKLAVNASYAHDDVARFGTVKQASLTDLEGHDLFVNYAVTKQLVVSVRALAAERITNREDGKRARLDIVYNF